MEPQDGALTQELDEVLHMQAQGVEGGCPALIVLLVDRDGGQAATHRPLLKHVNLHPGAEMLLKEVRHGRASDSSSDHGCQQAGGAGKERQNTGMRPRDTASRPPGPVILRHLHAVS